MTFLKVINLNKSTFKSF